MSDTESIASASPSFRSTTSSPSSRKVWNLENIFLQNENIRNIRRLTLTPVSSEAEIEKFKTLVQDRQTKSDTDFTIVAWKDEAVKPLGFKCMFKVLTFEQIKDFNSEQARPLFFDFFTDAKSLFETEKNIFDGKELKHNVYKFVKGFFIPDDANKIGGEEFYELKWADLYVLFEDIKRLPATSLFKKRMMTLHKKLDPTVVYKSIQPPRSRASSSASSVVGNEPQVPDDTNSPAKSVTQMGATLNASSFVALEGNLDKPENENSNQNLGKQPKMPPPTHKIAPKSNSNLRQELSSHFALALTVFHYNNMDRIGKPISLVIMAHFIEKATDDYRVKTRLLCYKEIANGSISKTGDLFKYTIKYHGLNSKYLVIVSRSNLKSAFSDTKHKWLQCHEEVLDNCTSEAMQNALISLTTSLLNVQPAQINPSPTVVCGNTKRKCKFAKQKLSKGLKEMQMFLDETIELAFPLKYHISVNYLLTIWFLRRNDLQNQEISEESCFDNLDDMCTDNIKKLNSIQLTASFLSPFDVDNWFDENQSNEYKFNDEHDEMVKSELEDFVNNTPDGQTVTKKVDKKLLETLMERPSFMQKLMQAKKNRIRSKGASKSQSSNVPIETETISDEVDRYKDKMKDGTKWDNWSQFEFWETQNSDFPKLKQAALFYMSVPSAILPSVRLLKNAINKAQKEKINEDAIEDRLFAIINEECAADGALINKRKQSLGEYSGGADKRPRAEEI